MKISVLICVVSLVVYCDKCFASSTYVNYIFPTRVVSNIIVSRMSDAIGDGIKEAIEHCGEQFKWEQWNCPKTAFSRRISQKLTREVAFARALTSAGIMHAVSRYCAKPGRKQCDCDEASGALLAAMNKYENKSPSGKYISLLQELTTVKSIQEEYDYEDTVNEVKTENEEVTWSWGGCSDDPGVGEKTIQQLLADFEIGSDAHAFAEKQNNLVGQKAVKDSMVRVCRCHGVSGSCSHQTCWMEVAPFEEIAGDLKRRYKKAIKISYGLVNRGLRLGNAPDLSERSYRKIKPKQLVYLDESPDYCIPDESTGWPGTVGRQCMRRNTTNSEERKSCQNLCIDCGYSMRKEVRIKRRRCNCAFKMCCEVRCQVCEDEIQEVFCV